MDFDKKGALFRPCSQVKSRPTKNLSSDRNAQMGRESVNCFQSFCDEILKFTMEGFFSVQNVQTVFPLLCPQIGEHRLQEPKTH